MSGLTAGITLGGSVRSMLMRSNGSVTTVSGSIECLMRWSTGSATTISWSDYAQ